MIDESLNDLAIEYVLGELKGAEGIRFLTVLDSDPELQKLVRELEETLGEVALTAPRVAPPAGVAVRLAKEIRSQKIVRPNFLPWSLAAALAIVSGLLAFDRELQRKESTERLERVETDRDIARRILASLAEKSGSDEKEIQRLTALAETYRKKSALSEIKIATLSAQVQSYANALAVVVWDSGKQEGLVKLDKLPKLPAGKDYQLWVLDPSYKQPVSAGILPADASGFARTVFKPAQEIHGAVHFAVSVEKAGGSAAPQGQIVLVGQ